MSAYYESPEMTDAYLMFHFGRAEDQMPWLDGPRSSVGFLQRIVARYLGEPILHQRRVLDVGCAVGGASWEIARWATEVVGVDFSQAFITAANQLKQEGQLTCSMCEIGRESSVIKIARPEVDCEKLNFLVGDAQQLDPALGVFDVVFAANLICRLPSPAQFLRQMADRIRIGGYLLITTPHTWLEEFTPKQDWLDGELQRGGTLAAIGAELDPFFSLVQRADEPFLIREHARKSQWSVAEVSLWQRC